MHNGTQQPDDSVGETELSDDAFADLKSRFYRFAITEGIWHKYVEPFMHRIRRQQRALGETRKESRRTAWIQAAECFTDETLKISKALHETYGAEPQGLTSRQGASWRLAFVALSEVAKQSPGLVQRANELVQYTQARIDRGQWRRGVEHLDKADFESAITAFGAGTLTCAAEVDRIASDLESIVPDETDDELQKELSLILEIIYEARTTMIRVLKDTWSSTSSAE